MVLYFTVNNWFGGGGGEMTALPAACSARLCFTSVFLPPNLSACRAMGVSILPPRRSWRLSPAQRSVSRWHVSQGATTYCVEWARTQPVSWKTSSFSQLFNSDLPNRSLLTQDQVCCMSEDLSFTFLSQCLHFKRLSARSRRATGG